MRTLFFLPLLSCLSACMVGHGPGWAVAIAGTNATTLSAGPDGIRATGVNQSEGLKLGAKAARNAALIKAAPGVLDSLSAGAARLAQ
jgi:hypothetical protein